MAASFPLAFRLAHAYLYGVRRRAEVRLRIASGDHDLFEAIAIEHFGRHENGDPMISDALLACAIIGAIAIVERGPRFLRDFDSIRCNGARAAVMASKSAQGRRKWTKRVRGRKCP